MVRVPPGQAALRRRHARYAEDWHAYPVRAARLRHGEHVNAGGHRAAMVVLTALGESDLVPDEGRPADALASRRGWRRRRRWRHVRVAAARAAERTGRVVRALRQKLL